MSAVLKLLKSRTSTQLTYITSGIKANKLNIVFGSKNQSFTQSVDLIQSVARSRLSGPNGLNQWNFFRYNTIPDRPILSSLQYIKDEKKKSVKKVSYQRRNDSFRRIGKRDVYGIEIWPLVNMTIHMKNDEKFDEGVLVIIGKNVVLKPGSSDKEEMSDGEGNDANDEMKCDDEKKKILREWYHSDTVRRVRCF